MPITLEADIAWPIDEDGQTRPIWRVQCDHGGPGDRLLLVAARALGIGRTGSPRCSADGRLAMSDLLEAALAYAALGWRVHPCRRDKTPLTASWKRDATTDPRVITAWWRRWPHANVAVATGAPGPDVLDVDTKNARAGMELFERSAETRRKRRRIAADLLDRTGTIDDRAWHTRAAAGTPGAPDLLSVSRAGRHG